MCRVAFTTLCTYHAKSTMHVTGDSHRGHWSRIIQPDARAEGGNNVTLCDVCPCQLAKPVPHQSHCSTMHSPKRSIRRNNGNVAARQNRWQLYTADSTCSLCCGDMTTRGTHHNNNPNHTATLVAITRIRQAASCVFTAVNCIFRLALHASLLRAVAAALQLAPAMRPGQQAVAAARRCSSPVARTFGAASCCQLLLDGFVVRLFIPCC